MNFGGQTRAHRQDVPRQVEFTILHLYCGWYVTLPEGDEIGPYLPNVALEAAMKCALLSRELGLDAHIVVQDEVGGTHRCMAIDWNDDPDRCEKCETSWLKSALPVTCPIKTSIGAFDIGH